MLYILLLLLSLPYLPLSSSSFMYPRPPQPASFGVSVAFFSRTSHRVGRREVEATRGGRAGFLRGHDEEGGREQGDAQVDHESRRGGQGGGIKCWSKEQKQGGGEQTGGGSSLRLTPGSLEGRGAAGRKVIEETKA
eukprot:761777-Hanusia_phi.AAC.1